MERAPLHAGNLPAGAGTGRHSDWFGRTADPGQPLRRSTSTLPATTKAMPRSASAVHW